ncbi:glycosyltransferase family A protein [Bradyrhizobium sp. JYMT SZCCT0428]|uniref:glycosyltransferase family 2 protein n=1 Tax=Bradyrhizobium sp. JYMT SZCCT0428 TaxID=2807673 RepID=UPI001BADC5ED|nr:glycosyltransferase family A protein [Bradyrhizobium sp. JYMT SZCCT0428]MBR1151564.1 glycosyltransferase family 2 protein [Bradyrhizobium sp. JYMT SZCCT0428]
MTPLVSVLIPAFNAEGTIADTLRSAMAQTYRNLEIIVVDDGSRDDTASIVSRLETDDSRIRLVQQANSGVAAARNAALSASGGSLIAPLDADDLWHPQKIEMQVNSLGTSGDGSGLDYCWYVDIDERSTILSCNVNRFEGDVYEDLILANFIGNSSVPLIRRSILEAVDGWDASLRAANAQGCEDWLLYLKIAERSRVALTPAFLAGYRQLPHAMSRNVLQMSRSYRLTMAQARSSHPGIAKTLLDRSAMDFDMYISRMCWTSARPVAALWFMLRSMMRAPLNWRHAARVLRELAQHPVARRRKAFSSDTTPTRGTIHGLAFNLLPPDAQCDLCQIHPTNTRSGAS